MDYRIFQPDVSHKMERVQVNGINVLYSFMAELNAGACGSGDFRHFLMICSFMKCQSFSVPHESLMPRGGRQEETIGKDKTSTHLWKMRKCSHN